MPYRTSAKVVAMVRVVLRVMQVVLRVMDKRGFKDSVSSVPVVGFTVLVWLRSQPIGIAGPCIKKSTGGNNGNSVMISRSI